MALQTILTKSYIEQVFDDVRMEKNLDGFLQESFPYDERQLLVTPQVKKPEGLAEKMIPTTDGDFQSAVALYEAYKGLKPLQAINTQLWESLSLTNLFPYMQKRWSLKESTDLKATILNHFTVRAHGLLRQGLSGLWWLVHHTVDESRDNRYELTEVLFKNYTLRFIRFGAGRVIQHKEAAIGILQYIKDHEKDISSLESVANGLTSYFNKLGAVKQLTYMDRDFFYQEMEKNIEYFLTATTHHENNKKAEEEE